ncbi:MAG: glycosyl hydrolase family 62 [Deltaproteobacteria bacterium]|nr:glycosyl hydrolase family 62 [Deltaproteobacteria bacterium]
MIADVLQHSDDTLSDLNNETDNITTSDNNDGTDSETEQGTSSDVDSDSDSDSVSDTDSTDSDSDTGISDSDSVVIPSRFQWEASDALITTSDWANWFKDPTAARDIEDSSIWHMYTSAELGNGLVLAYVQINDWGQLGSVSPVRVQFDTNPDGYRAAPQLFYFAPQQQWYLIYQTQNPRYSVTKTPGNPASWSESQQLVAMPDLIEGKEYTGFDYWVICDDAKCYLFFTGANGILYRAHTLKDDFPQGFDGSIVEVLGSVDDSSAIVEGGSVYKIAGADMYLLLVESRKFVEEEYYSAWTASALDGEWVALAASEATPFASNNNISNGDWTDVGILNGEIIRENSDETMTIDFQTLRFLCSGRTSEWDNYPIGVLTYKDSP